MNPRVIVLLLALAVSASAQKWERVADLNHGRFNHATVLLHDGRVLTMGGYTYAHGSSASTEIYDPAINAWRVVRNMPNRVIYHAAVTLSNGKVLVSGGTLGLSSQNEAFLFDPVNETWSETKPMIWYRYRHTLTLLPNGKVLAIGGEDDDVLLESCELYDPVSGTWEMTGSMKVVHSSHPATLLNDNTSVLVSGSTASDISEIYNITSGQWSSSQMNCGHWNHPASLLHDGSVLVAGGANGGGEGFCAEVFTPSTQKWTKVGQLLEDAITDHSQATLPNGTVLLIGGINCNPNCYYSRATVQAYNPFSQTWSFAAPLNVRRAAKKNVVQFPDGRLLIVGGEGRDNDVIEYVASCEMLIP